MPILMASNSSSCVTCLNKSSSAFICHSKWRETAGKLPVPSLLEALQVDVDSQGSDFLHQHVEGLRHPGIDLVVALDDVLVHLGAAGDVVRLHREHLLQRVRGAVG